MLRIKECKSLARRTLLGRYWTVIAAYFITIVIKVLMWMLTAASGFMTFVYAGVFGSLLGTGIAFSFPKLVCGVMLTMFLLAATIIVSLWFEIGSIKLMLNICRGLKGSVKDIFYGFRENSDAFCYILTGVVLGLITFVINAVQKLLYVLAGLIFANQMIHTAAVVIITIITLLAMWYVVTAFMFAKIVIADKRESTIAGALAASRRLMKGRKLKGFWLIYFSFLFWYILMFICGPAALWISPYILCTTVIFYMDADGTLWQLPGEDGAPVEDNVPSEDNAQGTPAADETDSQEDSASHDNAYNENAAGQNDATAQEENAPTPDDAPVPAEDASTPDDATAPTEDAPAQEEDVPVQANAAEQDNGEPTASTMVEDNNDSAADNDTEKGSSL